MDDENAENFYSVHLLNIDTTEMRYRYKTFYSQDRKQRELFRVI